MRLRSIAGVVLLLAAAAAPCRANGRAGQYPLDFLSLDAGARPAALGGAYAGLVQDANALLYNPAGLARVRRDQAVLMHNEYFQSVSQDYLAMALRQGVGLNLNYVGYGRIARTTVSQPDGTLGGFGASDLAAGAGYGFTVWDTLSLGVGVKYVRESIDDLTATAYAADAGLLLPVPAVPRLTLGAAVQNVGPTVRYLSAHEPLPLQVRVGAGYGLTLGQTENSLALDMVQTRSGSTLLAVGGETVLYKMMAVRAGFNTRNDAGLGFTAGLGWTAGPVSVDYAIVPYGELGLTHRVSLTVRWGKQGPARYRAAWSGLQDHSTWGAGLSAKTAEDPDSPEAHFKRAEQHRKGGYDTLAIRELNLAAEKLDPKDQRMVYYYEQLGYIAWLRGEVAKARAQYVEGLKLAMDLGLREPVVADVYAGLGMCLDYQGNQDFALKLFRKALEANPSAKTRDFVQRQIKRLTLDNAAGATAAP